MTFAEFNTSASIELPTNSPFKIKKIKRRSSWNIFTDNKKEEGTPFECKITASSGFSPFVTETSDTKPDFIETKGFGKTVSISEFPKITLRGDIVKIKAFGGECRVLNVKVIIPAVFGLSNILLTAGSVYEKTAPREFFENLSKVLKCLRIHGNKLPREAVSADNLMSRLASLNRSKKVIDMTPQIEAKSNPDGTVTLSGEFKSGRKYSEAIDIGDVKLQKENAESKESGSLKPSEKTAADSFIEQSLARREELMRKWCTTLTKNRFTIINGAFVDKNIKSPYIYLPNIKEIAALTFNGSRVKIVLIPDGCRVIGRNSFNRCSLLKEISFPENLKFIDYGAFFDCRSLEAAVIPKGCKKIGDSAFVNCPKLEAAVLPEGLTEIGEYSFYDCPKLKHAYLPSSLTKIGKYAFQIPGRDNSTGELIIHTPEGSAAQKYAVLNEIKYDNNY